MKIALVHSSLDPAGKTITRCMERLLADPGSPRPFPLKNHEVSYHRVHERLIGMDHIDKELDADLIIFLSRHSSEHPLPVLTVHVTGNIGPAHLGGIGGSLAVASPPWMHAVLCNLKKNAPEGYHVTYEVTHHGPTELSTPSFFVEIGSTEKEWTDSRAGEAVALSVLEADPADTVNVLGIGGTHYARRETEIALRSRAAFGHIVHSRFAATLDSAMIAALTKKSSARAVYIDKKALMHGELERIRTFLTDLAIPWLTEHELVQLRHITWTTWEEIRRAAWELHPGSTVEIPALIKDGSPRVVRVPDDLVTEAVRVDLSRLKEKIGQLPVISLSYGGNPVMPVFITTEENPALVLNDLISLCVTLICSGETTAIDGDRLIISRTRFDPEKARSLGIPPGPLFGDLMKGSPVNVNSREITPEMVRTRTETCILIPGLERLI